MHDYILSCCSTVDLTAKKLKDRRLSYLCYHYTSDGFDRTDDLWSGLSAAEFYRMMLDGVEIKTSQISVGSYIDYFEPMLESGTDVLHVCMSSGLTGSFNSARIAADILKEKYPSRKLYIADSLAGSSGYGMLMEKLADMRDEGQTADQLYDWLNQNRLRLHHWFYSTDLTFYIKGGRVSKTAGTIGGILGICPILDMSADGKITVRGKTRGKRRAMHELLELMERHADGGKNYSDRCYICHSDRSEEAKELGDAIKDRFSLTSDKVEIFDIGPTIGSHSGPGTLAVFFWGDERN